MANPNCEGCANYIMSKELYCSGKLNIEGDCPCIICIVKMVNVNCFCEDYTKWAKSRQYPFRQYS